jgi:O-antigen/teichoic acid export membrane protein
VAGALATNVAVMGLGVAASIAAARILGPTGRGELAALLTWAALAGALVQLGLPQALTYFAARHPEATLDVARSGARLMVWQFAALGVVSLGCSATLGRFVPQLGGIAPAILMLVPPTLLCTYVAAVLQGAASPTDWNASRLLGALPYPVAVVTAWGARDHSPAAIVLLAGTLGWVAALVGVALLLARSSRRRGASVECAALAGFGLRSHWGNLAWLANARMDQLIMSLALPLASLGHYAVAVSVASVLTPIPSAFANVVLGRVARAERSDARRELRQALHGTAILTAGLAVAAGGTTPWLLPLFFGAAFGPAVPATLILLPATVLLGLNYVMSDALRGAGRPGTVSSCEAIGSVVTVGGLLLMVPRFGIVGAAITSLVAYTLVHCLLWHRLGELKPS